MKPGDVVTITFTARVASAEGDALFVLPGPSSSAYYVEKGKADSRFALTDFGVLKKPLKVPAACCVVVRPSPVVVAEEIKPPPA